MTVGLLIVTHNEIGDALLRTAVNTFGGQCPLAVETISVTNDSDRDELLESARVMALRLDSGMGVLVLTDAYGSTPGNIATSLTGKDRSVTVLAGINLPMLIKVFNYSQLDLISLMGKAMNGAQESIVMCQLQDHAD